MISISFSHFFEKGRKYDSIWIGWHMIKFDEKGSTQMYWLDNFNYAHDKKADAF